MRLAVPLVLALLLSGCVSSLPVDELRQYGGAFDEAQTAANALFDDLAIAERRNIDKASNGDAARNSGVTPENERERLGYDPQYYAGEGLDIRPDDPPATAGLRRAMSVVARYNDILLMLAEGRTVDDIQTEVRALKGNAGALLSVTGGSGSVVAGLALEGLSTALGVAERVRSRKAFQDAFLDGHDHVQAILSGLKNAAPDMYSMIIDHYEDQIDDAEFDFGEGSEAFKRIQADAASRINAYRQAIRSYEGMFARVEEAFAKVRHIMEAPQTVSSATLILAEQTAQIRKDIDDMRHAFALLRVGPGDN